MRNTAYQFSEYVEQEIENLPLETYRSKNTREAKKLIEEYLPLSRLALSLKCPGLNIEVETTNEGSEADGIIYETGFRERVLYIQITHSSDHEESLRMELLNKQGHTPGSGPIYRDNKTKEIKAELTAINIDEHFERVSSKIVHLYDKKINKNYKSKMVLLISFFEFKIMGLPSWVKLYNMVNPKLQNSSLHFESVYLFNEASNEIYKIV